MFEQKQRQKRKSDWNAMPISASCVHAWQTTRIEIVQSEIQIENRRNKILLFERERLWLFFLLFLFILWRYISFTLWRSLSLSFRYRSFLLGILDSFLFLLVPCQQRMTCCPAAPETAAAAAVHLIGRHLLFASFLIQISTQIPEKPKQEPSRRCSVYVDVVVATVRSSSSSNREENVTIAVGRLVG